MLEYKGNNYRTKKDYASVANILNAISDDKSLVLFKSIAIDSSDFLISKVNLSCKQYYSRISNLIKSDLISRKNKRYFLTSFGKIVYDAQKRIEMAAEDHWKLKALDSFGLSSSASPQLPAEEYNRVIDTLMYGNDEIRDILHRYNNKNDISDAEKGKGYTQQLIPIRLSYE